MLKITPIEQKTGYTCGPTCIAMLADFYDANLSWSRIMRACKIDRNGMSNDDFTNALRRLDFIVTKRSRNTWKDLQSCYKKRLPVVVAWMLHGYIGHFSIVVEVTRTYIVLADPDNGLHRKMSKEIFMRLWYDYDDVFFPKSVKNIHLRWAAVIHGLRLAKKK